MTYDLVETVGIPSFTRKLDRFHATTYRAFRLDRGRARPLTIGDVSTLAETVEAAQLLCLHKEHLAIREEGGGKTSLHLYAIKRKSQPSYEGHGYDLRRVHTLYADPVCVIGEEAWSAEQEKVT
jgi:hypothetical protein